MGSDIQSVRQFRAMGVDAMLDRIPAGDAITSPSILTVLTRQSRGDWYAITWRVSVL